VSIMLPIGANGEKKPVEILGLLFVFFLVVQL
jgi:hypothetical protein